MFTAQGGCTVSPLHSRLANEFRFLAPRHVLSCIVGTLTTTRSTTKSTTATSSTSSLWSTSCTEHSTKRRSVWSSGQRFPANTRCARRNCVWPKKQLLKATAKKWLEWSVFLRGPLQCAFVFLILLVLCYQSSDDAFKCLPCGPQRFTFQQEGSFCYASSTNDQWTGMWSQGATAFFQEATCQCLRILYLVAWPMLRRRPVCFRNRRPDAVGLVYDPNGYMKVGDSHS